MAYRRSRLKLKHQDLAINADIRTAKLDPEAVEARPEIVRRDEKSGGLVVRQIYDKASGEALVEGYGYRWVNEDGEEVPEEDLQLVAIEDDEETPFTKHDPTIGSDRTVTAETWIPVGTIDGYLVDRVYEIWGEDDEDIAQLYDLAVHIRDFDEVPVVPWVLQASVYKSWGIITPFFYDEAFALIARITDRKIEPEHEMPALTEADLAERAEDETPTLEQESPFG